MLCDMDLTYKLVSDWNLKTGFDSLSKTDGIISVSQDARFSSSLISGNYDIVIDGHETHGVFSKSGAYDLYYFIYTSGQPTIEAVTVGGAEIRGTNPRIVVDGNDIRILYYDTSLFAIAALKKSGGIWTREVVDYVVMSSPPNFRQIDFKNLSGTIVGAYVYNFSSTEKSARYVELNGSKWVIDDVDIESQNDLNAIYIHKKNGVPLAIIASDSGVFSCKRTSGNWEVVALYAGFSASEIHAAYSASTASYHIAYVSNSEVRYQRFNSSSNLFLTNYMFIDFCANSVSVAVDSFDQPVISYSHVEKINPITSFLKVARGESDGDIFKTYNVSSSTNNQYAGYSSDVEFSSLDRLMIVHYNSGVKLYDENLSISEGEIVATEWKDTAYNNNLIASSNPPTRDIENTYIEFDKDNKNYFYISNDNLVDLDKEGVSFSIAFTIIPSGSCVDSQNIVSKIDENGNGYEVFLGGSAGLTLGFSIATVYGSIQSLVCELQSGEIAKVALVYSGYDVKFYVKRPNDGSFIVTTHTIAGDIVENDSPFVIGACGYKTGDSNPYYPYQDVNTHIFSSYLSAKILGLKYWKRELNYEEATYPDVGGVAYESDLDPYSDDLDYNTTGSPVADMHFVMNGENLSVDDYGGIQKVELLRYSNYNLEERITNASGYSVDPSMAIRRDGGVSLIWSDKRTGANEIYINDFDGNNAISSSKQRLSTIKECGVNGSVVSGSSVFVDTRAKFLDNGVFVGDWLNITSGSKYQGRKIPIIGVLSNTVLEIGAFFSESKSNVGYYIDFGKENETKDYSIKLTSLFETAINPKAVYDPSGDAHIVFQNLIDEYYEIYYLRYRSSLNSRQTWRPIRLTSSSGNSFEPSVGIDGLNTLHCIWDDTRNGIQSIFYAKSSPVSDGGNSLFPYWTSSALKGNDILMSGDIYSEGSDMMIDRDSVVHIVFAGRLSPQDESVTEIFYINNKEGRFSYPVRISQLNKKTSSPVIVEDCCLNKYVIFGAKIDKYSDIYMMKYSEKNGVWSFPKKISSTDADSFHPSAVIDADGVIYIHWIDRKGSGSSIGYAEYIVSSDEIVNDKVIRPSTAPTGSLSVSSVADSTKTVYVAWEDSREDTEGETEVYKNESINLISFDQQNVGDAEDKDSAQIIADQLSQVVIGQQFSDVVSPSELPLSEESLNQVKLVLYTDSVSYDVPFNLSNRDDDLAPEQTIALDYRRIGIKIEGLNKTIAYRIKNSDDSSSRYSEFFEFTIDESPNTTIGTWDLSNGNGKKSICVQLYTIKGLTSEFCVDLFLNEPILFDISLHNNEEGQVGEVVDTEYQEVKVLTSKEYWVKIYSHKLLSDDQMILFDVETQGENIVNIKTEKSGGDYVGKFALSTHDGVRHIDGSAKIIPRIV